MRHSHTTKSILGIITLALAGACADSVSVPTSEIAAKAPAGFNKVVGTTSFVYSPKTGATKRFGDHMIVIPAGGVCDPYAPGAAADYASKAWDKDCAAASAPIVFTVTSFEDANGVPYVQFEPSVRFVPTKETYLYLKDGTRKEAKILTIQYCSVATNCVDESLSDATLATHRLANSRILYRRLKHFSGYSVTSAGDCVGGTIEYQDGGMYCNMDGGRDRSGYMVASGLGKTSSGSDSFGRRRRER
ncbi:MAG TPA: hypothetical protein VIV65_01735 [Gemmatimonadaceae bacterium]|jgi:hypothetical protein